MAQTDENELVLTDKQISTIRRLALNELRLVENQMTHRIGFDPNIIHGQWWKNKMEQRANLQALLDGLEMGPDEAHPWRPEPPRAKATR